jgi:hypothetical protein
MKIFLWLLFLAGSLNAQTREFYLKLGGGGAHQVYRDEAMSPLLYQGWQPGVMIGFDDWRPKGLHRLDMLFWFGSTQARSGRTVVNYNFSVNGGYMRNLNLGDSPWKARLGGAFLIWTSLREHQTLINSYFFYDVFVGIGPNASVQRPFRMLRRDWIADAQLTFPLLSYGARPSYSGLEQAPFQNEDFPDLRTYGLNSLHNYQHLKLRLELVKPLKRGNRLSLVYHWEGYRSTLTPALSAHSLQSIQCHLHVRL